MTAVTITRNYSEDKVSEQLKKKKKASMGLSYGFDANVE